MDINTALDFILTKTQRDIFVANWKALHATKNHQLTAEDYLLFQIFNPAIVDIPRKAKQAFSPSKYQNRPFITYTTTIQNLKYRFVNKYPFAYPCMAGTTLTPEQYDRTFAILTDLFKAI